MGRMLCEVSLTAGNIQIDYIQKSYTFLCIVFGMTNAITTVLLRLTGTLSKLMETVTFCDIVLEFCPGTENSLIKK